MFAFVPEKLFLEFQNEEQGNNRIMPRRYTLTHSDQTGEMFLSIGREYDYNKSNKVDDEVLAEWIKEGDNYILSVMVDVDGGSGLVKTVERDKLYRESLPLALKAIVYGDRALIKNNDGLKDADIVVNFKSGMPEYNKVESWGKISDYTYEDEQRSHMRQIDPQYIPPIIYPPYPGPGPGPGPYPGPQPQPIPTPFPPSGPTQGKNRIIENSLINTLSSYIKSEVYVAFGRNAYYCLGEAEVIRARTIRTYGPCSEEYEVVVGLRVGRRRPRENNLRITFVINENSIRVRDVDKPRPRPRD